MEAASGTISVTQIWMEIDGEDGKFDNNNVLDKYENVSLIVNASIKN